jgi:hypothetical protein
MKFRSDGVDCGGVRNEITRDDIILWQWGVMDMPIHIDKWNGFEGS